MSIFKNAYFKIASEDTLRKKSNKVSAQLSKLDYDSKKHTRLSNKSVELVNAVASKSAGRLPKREHGWYLDKD